MANEVGNQELQKEIKFSHITSFIKKNWGRTVCFGFVSLIIAGLVIAAAYLLLPRNVSYVSNIHLQLPKVQGVMVYPNEKRFSTNDILSNSVLKTVYDNNKLEGKIKFDEFCELFSLTGLDVERAKLSAAFREKLNNKKITVVELKELETEYANALLKLDNAAVSIAMAPSLVFTEHEMVKILNEIPKVWFDIYSKQEAKVFPEIETVALIEELRKNADIEGKMVSFDKARNICYGLNKACKELDEMIAGTKMALPTGEFLSDLQERLSDLINHRIQTLILIVRELPEYQHPLDKIAIIARVMDFDKKIKLEKAKYDATIEAISILVANGRKDVAATQQAGQADSKASSSITLDNEFLTSLETLIRQAQASELREEYANKALEHKTEIADLESEKEYYTLLSENAGRGTLVKIVNKDQFNRMESIMFTELIDLCGKINQFRDMVFNDYVKNREFFTTTGRVEKLSQFPIPFARIAAGIIVLVLLLNVICAAKSFYAMLEKGELDK